MPASSIGRLKAAPPAEGTRKASPFSRAASPNSAASSRRIGRSGTETWRSSPDRSRSCSASTSWPSMPASRLVARSARVLPHRRELLAEGRSLDLGGRAFDVLMALLEASGAVVSKDALMNRVWPNRIVEENSLQAQISALRRAFGADRELIRTIAGRGYQFTGEIRTVSGRPDARAVAGMQQPTPSRPPTNLPEPVSELIGRDVELDEILDLSSSHRLVTLTGAGGIGKTRLSLEVARHLLPNIVDGVWAAELAPLS